MTFFEIIVLTCLFSAGYFLGKNLSKGSPSNPKSLSTKKSEYRPVDDDKDLEHGDEMKSWFKKDDFEDNQREIDKLMRELSEAKKKEKKYQAEIHMLKNQIKERESTSSSNSTTVTPTPGQETLSGKAEEPQEFANKDLDDLINDQEMNSLIDGARFDGNEIIDTDRLNQEIEDDLEGHLLG